MPKFIYRCFQANAVKCIGPGLALVLFATTALATTVQKFTFEEMVGLSELIIEAEVDNVTEHRVAGLVYTRVLFRVHDVLKGNNPGGLLELGFLGGEQDGATVRVAGQDIPVRGEKGFYFIESVTGHSVNPLVGWSQGHFRIVTDAKGNETLETDIRQEILELSDSKNAALAEKLKNMKFGSQLVKEAEYIPVTPDELRDAVAGFLGSD